MAAVSRAAESAFRDISRLRFGSDAEFCFEPHGQASRWLRSQ